MSQKEIGRNEMVTTIQKVEVVKKIQKFLNDGWIIQ